MRPHDPLGGRCIAPTAGARLSQPGGPLYQIEVSNGGLITFPGGVPLQADGGTVIGAIGVSGSTVEDDHAVASAGSACCGSLGCGDNGCAGGSVCFQHEGGGCAGDCDCRGDLYCSERQGDTCQDCAYPETPCVTSSDCCLQDSICGYNGCVLETTCCQWEIGSFCYDDCDCCEELGCFSSTCLPLLAADGAERERGADKSAEPRPGKGRWPRHQATGTPRKDASP